MLMQWKKKSKELMKSVENIDFATEEYPRINLELIQEHLPKVSPLVSPKQKKKKKKETPTKKENEKPNYLDLTSINLREKSDRIKYLEFRESEINKPFENRLALIRNPLEMNNFQLEEDAKSSTIEFNKNDMDIPTNENTNQIYFFPEVSYLASSLPRIPMIEDLDQFESVLPSVTCLNIMKETFLNSIAKSEYDGVTIQALEVLVDVISVQISDVAIIMKEYPKANSNNETPIAFLEKNFSKAFHLSNGFADLIKFKNEIEKKED